MAIGERKLALIDRDGTIIADEHYLSDPDKIQLIPGAIDGLRLLRKHGFLLAMVTNQSGIGRGFFSYSDFRAVQARLKAMLAERGVRFDEIYFCPHDPDADCSCRKPRPGMLYTAMIRFDTPRHWTVMIGDSVVDKMAAEAADVDFVMIRGNFLDAAKSVVALFKGDGEL